MSSAGRSIAREVSSSSGQRVYTGASASSFLSGVAIAAMVFAAPASSPRAIWMRPSRASRPRSNSGDSCRASGLALRTRSASSSSLPAACAAADQLERRRRDLSAGLEPGRPRPVRSAATGRLRLSFAASFAHAGAGNEGPARPRAARPAGRRAAAPRRRAARNGPSAPACAPPSSTPPASSAKNDSSIRARRARRSATESPAPPGRNQVGLLRRTKAPAASGPAARRCAPAPRSGP